MTLGAVECSSNVGGLELLCCVHHSGLRLGRHDHERASLQLGLRGYCDELVGSRAYELGPGVALFKPAGTHHTNAVRSSDYFSLIVGIPPGYDHLPADVAVASSGAILQVARRLGAELSARAAGWRAIAESCVLEILGHVERSRAVAESERWLDSAAELAAEGQTVSEIAHQLARSPSSVARAFRNRFGVSVGEFGRAERLHRARIALRSSKPLSEIALELGFCDQSHLTRCFTAQFGVSPARYRRDLSRAAVS